MSAALLLAAALSGPPTAAVPAATFQMGKTVNHGYGDIDGPTHEVRIARPFELAVHEVTLGEFRAFVKDTGYVSERKCNVYNAGSSWFIDTMRNWADPGFPQAENHPVVCVSWRDARAYIDWLNRKTGQAYRLPSEAEYEYAAGQGGLNEVTHDKANIGKVECCGGETGGRDTWTHTAPVGSFPPDRFGVRDLRGNVWEWQEDCYNADYLSAPVDGSPRTSCADPGYHTIRGGSYGDAAEFLSERFRLRGREDQGFFTVGFRVARSVEAGPASAAVAMLDATRRRDVAALGESLATSVEPEIVYYWGDTVSGREALLQWRREWFDEAGWVSEPEQHGRVLVGQDLATLTYTVGYTKNPTRNFRILMTCTMIREGGAWKVARVQQTLLEGPTS